MNQSRPKNEPEMKAVSQNPLKGLTTPFKCLIMTPYLKPVPKVLCGSASCVFGGCIRYLFGEDTNDPFIP